MSPLVPVEKVVLEPDEDLSFLRRPKSRHRSRSAEQLTFNHNRHRHHHCRRQYNSDCNIHNHHHHHHRHKHSHNRSPAHDSHNKENQQSARHRRLQECTSEPSSPSSSHYRLRRQHNHINDSASETSSHHHHRPRRHHNHSSSMSESCSTASSHRRTNSVASRVSSCYSWDNGPIPELLRQDNDMTLNLSLCGCGFLGIYHLGVASCMVKHGQKLLARLDRVAGASAGALAAAVLVSAPTTRHVEISTEMLTGLAKKIRRKPLGALTPGFQLTKQVAKLLDKVLPPDAHELARGRLHVSLTRAKTHKNEVITDFDTREELIEALVASCHIPVYSGRKTPTLRGEHYCDGGLTDNLVRFSDGRTITVSPFSGKQDIGPHDALAKGTKGNYFNLHNQDIQLNFNNIRRFGHAFFPPRRDVLQQYFELGHKDASRFLIKEGLYEIQMPGEKKPLVYESSV